MSKPGACVKELKDKTGRKARYLRISITDRCNFQCVYCRDPRRLRHIPHDEILRYEDLLRFAGIAKKMGVGKIRVSGGEPLARKNCVPFMLDLRKAFPDLRLCLTTNGSLLEPWLNDLARLAPESVNISLDSFERASFAKITGQDALPQVLNNIDGLLSRGVRVKLNAVAMRGLTDRELGNFIHAARTMPVDLRFIEFMPMGASTMWTEESFLPAGELSALINARAALSPAAPQDSSGMAGPAKMFKMEGAKGRIGFITALSDHFCKECNRLRLTSDGRLRSCLFSDKEFPLAPMLRNEKVSDEAIARAVEAAHAVKPLGADLLRAKTRLAVAEKGMSGIGG